MEAIDDAMVGGDAVIGGDSVVTGGAITSGALTDAAVRGEGGLRRDDAGRVVASRSRS